MKENTTFGRRGGLVAILLACSPWLSAQDGRHIMARYNVENNTWKLQDYQKVNTTVTYPEIYYMRAFGRGGGNFELGFPGIFSGMSGNLFTTSSDDSLQISNFRICHFIARHYPVTSSDESHGFGFAWGIDFNGHQLVTGADEGKMTGMSKPDSHEIAHVTGLGVIFGLTYEYNMDDVLIINTDLLVNLLFNSQSALNNEMTWHSKGWRAQVRARYYLSSHWVAVADLTVESNRHNPNQIAFNEPSGYSHIPALA